MEDRDGALVAALEGARVGEGASEMVIGRSVVPERPELVAACGGSVSYRGGGGEEARETAGDRPLGGG